MSEGDYGSGSSSSDTSGSGDGSDHSGGSGGRGGSWGDAAIDAAGLLFTDAGGPTRPRTAGTGDARPDVSFNAALQRLFETGGPVVDGRSLPRRVVEHQRWYVPVGPDGRDPLLSVPNKERTRRPFARALAGGQPARTARLGRTDTLRVARAFALPPAAAAGPSVREVSGRVLARDMPAGAGGVIFTLATGDTVGLLRDEWPLLEQLADSLDLEDVLVRPRPGQVAALQEARWYVSAKDGTRPRLWSSSQVIRVYTHPDRAEASDERMRELCGVQLARLLAGRTDYDGVMVNLGTRVGTGDDETRVFSLGPDFGPALMRGVDPRPGVAPLPARTLAEVDLWLDFAQFPRSGQGRKLVPVASPAGITPSDGTGVPDEAGQGNVVPGGGASVLVQARTGRGSTWRIFETAFSQRERPGPTLGPVFAVGQPDAPLGYLGDGPTQMLCAGKLAKLLHDDRLWKPPRWFVAKEHRLRAAKFAGWAHELLKLLPPGADALPRSSLRTLHGAEMVRHAPKIASRAWIEERFAFYDGVVRRGWLGL